MNKEQLEEYEKNLLSSISHQTRKIVEQEPIEQLRSIQKNLQRTRLYKRTEQGKHQAKLPTEKQRQRAFKESSLEPIINLLDKLIQDLTEGAKRSKNEKDYWKEVDFKILSAVSYQIQVSFSHYLNYCFLQGFLTSKFNRVLNDGYRKQLRKDFDLETNGKLQKALMPLLEPLFRDEIKHGGSKGFWDDNNKLEFLALYNRFLIIIKNCRKDIKPLIKKGKSELSSRREILVKYEIPETLIKSAFSSYDAPKEVALDWAKQEMKLNFKEEYLKDILTEARKIWRSKSIGLISQQTLKEHPEIQLILIGINFEIGCRYYAVSSVNKKDMERLKYGTVAKKLNGKYERVIGEEWDDFLVGMTF
jgi:hypothetical protein